jgi:hypothetical protein
MNDCVLLLPIYTFMVWTDSSDFYYQYGSIYAASWNVCGRILSEMDVLLVYGSAA